MIIILVHKVIEISDDQITTGCMDLGQYKTSRDRGDPNDAYAWLKRDCVGVMVAFKCKEHNDHYVIVSSHDHRIVVSMILHVSAHFQSSHKERTRMSVKFRIGSEWWVNEATGSVAQTRASRDT
ncbi:hypothetical protein Tco_1103410 [Tanacetum coccineum]